QRAAERRGAADCHHQRAVRGRRAYSPALMDFLIMVTKSANMFICGPNVIEAATGQKCTMEQIGSPQAHASVSGNIHFLADDDEAAIALAQQMGKQVSLVTFGHMHHRLRHTQQLRQRLVQDRAGTVYLNAASVPRIIRTESTCVRNFSLVVIEQGEVVEAALVWLDENFAIASQEVLYSRPVESFSLK
ncbi:MAG: hypothetical protein HC839_06015, partial [Leptolyngbyaceae cyanobacterium RM2_2_21]|nr:hypothetical protein [Leptolyngbyaceae cyanobacterium RM2_2_21]